MAELISVTGATGFVGGYLVPALVEAGERVRCIARRREAFEEKGLDKLGCEFVEADINDYKSIKKALTGSGIVIHLAAGVKNIDKVIYEGTKNVVRVCEEAKIPRLIFMSIIGSTPDEGRKILRAKGKAEEAIKGSKLDYTIFRSTIIYGRGGKFIATLTKLAKGPTLFTPVAGSGKVRVQPIYVKDVVNFITKSLREKVAFRKSFEIGGEDQLLFDEVVDAVAEAVGKKRRKIHIPIWLLKPGIWLRELIPFGAPMITIGELQLLQKDYVCDPSISVKTFGVKLTSFKEGLKETLAS